jgi:hypothetical protein
MPTELEERTQAEIEEEEEKKIKDIKLKKELEERLVDDVKLWIEDPETADVTFLVGNLSKGDTLKPIKGHRILLAPRW